MIPKSPAARSRPGFSFAALPCRVARQAQHKADNGISETRADHGRARLGVDDVTRFTRIVEGVKGKRLTYRSVDRKAEAQA